MDSGCVIRTAKEAKAGTWLMCTRVILEASRTDEAAEYEDMFRRIVFAAQSDV